MKTKDIFGLAIRLLGLFLLYHLVLGAPALIGMLTSGGGQSLLGLIGIAALTATTWWLIGGAPLLMERAYPTEKQSEDSSAPVFGKKSEGQ